MTTPQVSLPGFPKCILIAYHELCHALHGASISARCEHCSDGHHAALAGNGVVPAAIQDPFLQRLVRKDVITAKKVGQKAKELMKDAPAVEQQLILRAESTKEHLARLFELQEGYQERLTTFLRTAAQSIGQAELTQQVSSRLTLFITNSRRLTFSFYLWGQRCIILMPDGHVPRRCMQISLYTSEKVSS